MLTRLFNNISIQAGIITGLSLILLSGVSVYFIEIQDLRLEFLNFNLVFGTSLIKLIFVFTISIVALIFASNVNFLGIFPAAFQQSMLFGFSFLLISQFQVSLNLLLALPLILLAFRKIFKIGMLDDPRHLLFDIGLISGIISLFYIQSVILICFCWTASLIYRSFNIKTIIIPVIGLFAAYTSAFFLSYLWPEFEFLTILKNQYSQLKWGFASHSGEIGVKLLGLLLLGFVAMLNTLKNIGKATVFKRQVLSLCIALPLIGILWAASQESSDQLLVFMIFPIGIILYDFILSLKKWWQQDLIYLILILNLVLVLL